jgi:hypothetical protein
MKFASPTKFNRKSGVAQLIWIALILGNEFRRQNPSTYGDLFCMQDTVTERKKSRKQVFSRSRP